MKSAASLLAALTSEEEHIHQHSKEKHSDEYAADHHRLIAEALKNQDLAKAQRLMNPHLADSESRVSLTKG